MKRLWDQSQSLTSALTFDLFQSPYCCSGWVGPVKPVPAESRPGVQALMGLQKRLHPKCNVCSASRSRPGKMVCFRNEKSFSTFLRRSRKEAGFLQAAEASPPPNPTWLHLQTCFWVSTPGDEQLLTPPQLLIVLPRSHCFLIVFLIVSWSACSGLALGVSWGRSSVFKLPSRLWD